MATLREFVIFQSTLAAGNTVRDHLENPAIIGSGAGFIYSKEPIQVSESEILQIADTEILGSNERENLIMETEGIVLQMDESEILEVEDGDN